MSSVKVAINGFGRIGRLVFRQIYNTPGIEVVAINDLTSPAVLAHLLKYDSAQGRFDAEVKSTEDSVLVNGHAVKIYAQRDPSQIPWGAHDVDVVIESTGFFTDKEKAELHIKAGAKRVVISHFSSLSCALSFVKARSASADSEPRIKYKAFILASLAPVKQFNPTFAFTDP